MFLYVLLKYVNNFSNSDDPCCSVVTDVLSAKCTVTGSIFPTEEKFPYSFVICWEAPESTMKPSWWKLSGNVAIWIFDFCPRICLFFQTYRFEQYVQAYFNYNNVYGIDYLFFFRWQLLVYGYPSSYFLLPTCLENDILWLDMSPPKPCPMWLFLRSRVFKAAIVLFKDSSFIEPSRFATGFSSTTGRPMSASLLKYVFSLVK